MAGQKGVRRALDLLRVLPRVELNNVTGYEKKIYKRGRGHHGGGTHGTRNKGAKHHQCWAKLGTEGGQTPFYLRVPWEDYYKDHHLKREYPPLSLGMLQLMIHTNRVDPTQPIDLTTICNTKLIKLTPMSQFNRHFGVQLSLDGVDQFRAKINIEVQYAPEAVIAAIERNGGFITTAYYDKQAVCTLVDPLQFFLKGQPIPKRLLPPQNAVKYYTDPKSRGYLADREAIEEERFKLAQKYGYSLPDVEKDPMKDMLLYKKDPQQIFSGLQAGWLVNLKDKVVLKPKGKEWEEYYRS